MESLGHDLENEVRYLVKDYIEKNLKVVVEFNKAKAYWETNTITTKVYLEGDLVSEEQTYPDI